MKILIAETNSLTRFQLTKLLRIFEHEVIELTNGEDVLNELKKADPPRLVIIDWVLIRGDALKTINQIRSLNCIHPRYIIALTIENHKADMLSELKTDIDDYIVKPFISEEVQIRIAAINRLVEMQLKFQSYARKQNQEHEGLQALGGAHKALSDGAFEALFLSKNGIGLCQNPTAEKMFGYSLEEAIGQQVMGWLAPSEREKAIKKVHQGDEQPYESIGLHKNGKTFPIEIQGRMLDYQGEKYRITAMRDITARKIAENKLLMSEQRFKTLIDEVSEIAIQGYDEERSVLFWNKASEQLYGYSKAEALGQKLEDLIIPEEKRQDMINLHSKWVALGEKIPPGKLDLTDRDGKVVHVFSSPVLVETPTAKEMFCIDINLSPIRKVEDEKKELEIQLLQKQKMEALGVMAAGIAHDFNNVLAIILSNIELLEMNLEPKATDLESLSYIKSAISRAGGTVRQILTYCLHTEEELETIELASVINESLKLIRASIPASVDILKRIDSSSNAICIKGISNQIEQVLINLCNNAVFSMDNQGVLEVSLKPVLLKEKDLPAHEKHVPGHYLSLTVEDTGKGISDKNLTRIFDPFFTTKPPHEGSGMGLSIVQGIVKKHSGFLSVDTILDQGSSFKIFFPVITSATMESNSSCITISRDSVNVLLVDDEETLLQAIDKLLGHQGFTVTAVKSSTKALNLFQANPEDFDLVITDQLMPDLYGIQLIAEMRKIKPNLPSILCTGHTINLAQTELEDLGIQKILLKPLSVPLLVQAVIKVMVKDR